MKLSTPSRIRDTVYVIGAGFSKGLGYPLTNQLLTDVWELSLAKTLTDSEINNIAAAVSSALCYNS